jgi:hypothetical protein
MSGVERAHTQLGRLRLDERLHPPLFGDVDEDGERPEGRAVRPSLEDAVQEHLADLAVLLDELVTDVPFLVEEYLHRPAALGFAAGRWSVSIERWGLSPVNRRTG